VKYSSRGRGDNPWGDRHPVDFWRKNLVDNQRKGGNKIRGRNKREGTKRGLGIDSKEGGFIQKTTSLVVSAGGGRNAAMMSSQTKKMRFSWGGGLIFLEPGSGLPKKTA